MPETPHAAVDERRGRARFIAATLVGLVFFLLPIPAEGSWTIPFDLLINAIKDTAPSAVRYYTLAAVLLAAVLTVGVALQKGGVLPTGRVDLRLFEIGRAHV